jgi:hypothetical protein
VTAHGSRSSPVAEPPPWGDDLDLVVDLEVPRFDLDGDGDVDPIVDLDVS